MIVIGGVDMGRKVLGLVTVVGLVLVTAVSAAAQVDRATLTGFLAGKAGELVDTSKTAAGKIDAAMSRIRAVLHSNTPE